MKVLVHDFAGHPFQAQLSRELARRGHEIDHAYCGGVVTGRGDLTCREEDPGSLTFTDLSDAPFERYAPLGRIRSEVHYGRRLAAHVRATQPDIVLSANTPLLSLTQAWVAAHRVGATRAYWVQDFLGRGTRAILSDRSPAAGATIGAAFERLETELLRRADALVLIADDFTTELARRRVSTPSVVIENWAPLDELAPRPKDNPWSRRHGLHDRQVALYSGTLGLKHDPQHLVAVAERLQGTGHVAVVVTEGAGRDLLEAERDRRGLHETLVLLDYVDYADLPDVLGTADACLVLLEAEAGSFSVPSKVLSYLAAGRAIVAAVPLENLAARTIDRAGAGRVRAPGDHEGYAADVADVLAHPDLQVNLARSARTYAEQAFDIESIADRMLGALTRHRPLAGRSTPRASTPSPLPAGADTP